MKAMIKKFLFGASVVLGASAIGPAPSFAYSITGNNDYLLYDNNTATCPATSTCLTNDISRLDAILGGNSSSPGGNVELFASSETVELPRFLGSNARTSIQGTVAGKSLTLSSLTATDWFGSSLNTEYGQSNLANTWFNAFYDAAGISSNLNNVLSNSLTKTFFTATVAQTTGQNWSSLTNNQIQGAARVLAYNTFLSDQIKGFQRTSDPNISYITTSGNDLLIGLAGHFNAKAFYSSMLGPFASLINNGFQVSEVVKAQYGSDPAQLLYSFSATASGLVNNVGTGNDGLSHTGNYEVALRGVVPPASVPEPSVVFGLIGLGGFLAAKRKGMNKA